LQKSLEVQWFAMNLAAQVIGSILKHDKKVNSYKIALVRAVNDVVLSYPDLVDANPDVAVPLRRLAQQWLAYYWPFMEPGSPVLQGTKARRGGVLGNDVSFRPALTRLRTVWADQFGPARPSDGFLVVAELRVPRIAASYPSDLRRDFRTAVSAISAALHQPIRYAGPGGTQYHVFPSPRPAAAWADAVPVPGTAANEPCVLIGADLWAAFHELSLWIEALCIHEWSLFTERATASGIDRGRAYSLLTSRPDNRRPLTWERNQVELIMLEGGMFECPWTAKKLTPSGYAMDHIVPISVYPTNELWNLVPSDARFNAHVKRARMPTPPRMAEATLRLARTYALYTTSPILKDALGADLEERFALAPVAGPRDIAAAVAKATLSIANARGVERF
jgi:hypothetical protein